MALVFESLAAIIWSYRPAGKRTKLFPVALDWTKVHAFSVLFTAMPRKSRALPLAFGAYHPDRLQRSQNKLVRGMCTLVASLLPKDATPPVPCRYAGFDRTEFIRWLQRQRFAFVVRLRSETLVHHRGRTCPLGQLNTIEGWPIILSNVQYRGKKPVTVHIVISRLGDSVIFPRQSGYRDKRRHGIIPQSEGRNEESEKAVHPRVQVRSSPTTRDQW